MAEYFSDYQIERLNEDNYFFWSIRIKCYMQLHEVWEAIEEEAPAEDTGLEAWTKKDAEAKAIIALSIADNQIRIVRNEKTAKCMWDALKRHHEATSLCTKLNLYQQLIRARLHKDEDMEKHLHKMQMIWHRLELKGMEIPEQQLVVMILSSLPESYNVFIHALDCQAEEITLFDLTVKLRGMAELRCLRSKSGNHKK